MRDAKFMVKFFSCTCIKFFAFSYFFSSVTIKYHIFIIIFIFISYYYILENEVINILVSHTRLVVYIFFVEYVLYALYNFFSKCVISIFMVQTHKTCISIFACILPTCKYKTVYK